MKSPETLYKTETVEVPRLIETIKYETIIRPNNCIHPEAASPKDVENAAEVINYYRREWVYKYKACLASLNN